MKPNDPKVNSILYEAFPFGDGCTAREALMRTKIELSVRGVSMKARSWAKSGWLQPVGHQKRCYLSGTITAILYVRTMPTADFLAALEKRTQAVKRGMDALRKSFRRAPSFLDTPDDHDDWPIEQERLRVAAEEFHTVWQRGTLQGLIQWQMGR